MRKIDVTGVCLNPSIDRALTIEGFEYGGTNRVLSSVDYAGGKGFNVAIAARKLGLKSAAAGFIFDENGGIILRSLEAEDVDNQTLSIPGSVRVNLKVYDTKTQVVTEVNSKGEPIGADMQERLFSKIEELARISEYMVFGGSVAPGLGDDTYQKLIESAEACGCKCILDAEGELLKKGIEAKPFMIKPNLFELQMLTRKKLDSTGEIKAAVQEIIKSGVQIVLVSLGGDGAMIATKDEAWFAQGMKVAVKNTVGAGDTMVSGAVKGLLGGGDARQVLRQAAAAATCSITQEGTGLTDTSTLSDIYKNVKISNI